MLELIANALKDYNDYGRAVIKGSEEHEAKVVAKYVTSVLDGLKCSYEYKSNQMINLVILEDRMMEVE